MTQTDPSPEAWKQALKEAISETLVEQRDFFHDVFAEVLEDMALRSAIEEGATTKLVARQEIFDRLEGRD